MTIADTPGDRRLLELEQQFYERKRETNVLLEGGDLDAAQKREWKVLRDMARVEPDGPSGYAAIARTLKANRIDLAMGISGQASNEIEAALISRCLSWIAGDEVEVA